MESLPPEKSEHLIVGDMLLGNGITLLKNKAHKQVQATPRIKNQNTETGFDLLTTYKGAKGKQFVKQSENQQTLDLEIDKEF